MARRSYGSGSLTTRRDANGVETWYGWWRAGGRRVKRALGPKRAPGSRDGLTRAQAEAELRRRMSEKTVVIGRADRIEPPHVEEYMHHKLATLAPKTVTNQLTFPHALFAFAVKRRWAESNPVGLVDRPPAARQHAMRLPSSDGTAMVFRRFADARADEVVPDLYWLEGYGGGLFVPFADATSGAETYAAGRYLLDTVKGADLGAEAGRLVLDFNFAYQPSCSYDSRWTCPLAPPANRLDVRIEAGERPD